MSFRISHFRDTDFNDIDGTGVFNLDAIVLCDTVDDLPGRYDIAYHKLVLGCKAIITSTGDKYYLCSNGQWKKDESGGGGGSGLCGIHVSDAKPLFQTPETSDGGQRNRGALCGEPLQHRERKSKLF